MSSLFQENKISKKGNCSNSRNTIITYNLNYISSISSGIAKFIKLLDKSIHPILNLL